MSHRSWIPVTRRATVVVSLMVALSAGAPLLAQQTVPPAQAAPQQAAAPQGPTLELSLAQAVAMALETNLGLKSDRYSLAISAQGIAAARAAFLPTLTGSVTRVASTSVTTNQFESAESITKRSNLNGGAQWGQALPWYGSSYTVSWGALRNATNAFTSFNPTLGSSLTVSFRQPLWQRFSIDGNRFSLENAQRSYQIADLTMQQQLIATQDQVRLAYLSLASAIAGLGVARENKDVNDVALRNARARIAVGNAALIDQIQSEAAVLTSEEAVIISEANVSTAEDVLRSLLLDPARPDYWQVHIVLTDQIEVQERTIDVDAAIKNALANRIDLLSARQQSAQTQLAMRLNQNLTKPSLDFAATYSASGTGGVPLDSQTGLPIGQAIGFGSALGDAFGHQNPAWTFGIQAGVPIGQTASRVAVARTQIQLDQQQLNLRNQELQIIAQVRDAARRVESGYRRVRSTQLALTASEQQKRAEERKLEVGMASTFDVLLKAQALASARSAELAAKIAYNTALINFERVQKIR